MVTQSLWIQLINEGDEIINKEQEDDKTPAVGKYNKWNLIYNNNRRFYKYHNIKKINYLPFKSKYSYLV